MKAGCEAAAWAATAHGGPADIGQNSHKGCTRQSDRWQFPAASAVGSTFLEPSALVPAKGSFRGSWGHLGLSVAHGAQGARLRRMTNSPNRICRTRYPPLPPLKEEKGVKCEMWNVPLPYIENRTLMGFWITRLPRQGEQGQGDEKTSQGWKGSPFFNPETCPSLQDFFDFD